ncbi:hypothetical protein Clacol_009126 [Clathrus columnatus]|uniref:Uncharacterized protein n=1 Tax=Clathrus columnatus TaxID=1419009 RepID=A0AAV5AP79_9AGAM|nr:hypothetical protein Clacol_009126 [Clathrus columnatus]
MKTFKIHGLGHYVSDIQTFGSTDSYSTQIVPEHQVGSRGTSGEMKELISPEDAYHIYPNDPAFQNGIQDFLPKLRNHLLSRIHGIGGIRDESSFDGIGTSTIYFQHECIYSHAILRINFTTYDLRRDQDFINPQTSKRFIMVASNDDSEEECHKYPFWYAQVLGIFHADIFTATNQSTMKPTHMNFLWVRWLGQDPIWKSGFKFHKLDHIGFIPHQDKDAFGFLDPAAVIRATHLIPAFAYGRTIDLCPPLVGRDDEGDWQYFYVNRFVDRDMLMRYLGIGVGHKSPTEKSYEDASFHMENADTLDMQEGVMNSESENEGTFGITEDEISISEDEVNDDSGDNDTDMGDIDLTSDFDEGYEF